MKHIWTFIILIQKFLKQLKKDAVAAYAAQASYFTILSAFPFCMFLLTMIQYLPFTEQDLLNAAASVFPSGLNTYATVMIQEIYHSSAAAIISVTAITTLWSASKAFFSLISGLNAIHKIEENRNYIALRVVAAIYTLVFTVMLIVCLSLFVFGNTLVAALTHMFPVMQNLLLLIISIRTIVFLFILIIFFLLLYLVIPNRKSKIKTELPGAVLVSVGWLGFSYLYSFYIDNFASFGNTYGSLTAIVLFMLWLYVCMYMLFIGAEFNADKGKTLKPLEHKNLLKNGSVSHY